MATQPSQEILDWAKKQPLWHRDALRRILTRPFTRADEDECLELLKAEHGLLKTNIKPDPLDQKHLPVRSTSATNLRLVALDGIQNVNRLSKEAALPLSVEGVTLIYGDNGSGKSGFIRILKKACRSRHDEAILPDVFAAAGGKSPATARFMVEEGASKQPPIIWSDDGKPSSDVLSRLAIFDSKCASVHVDGENRLKVVPHNLDCFQKLAEVCDRLRARLKDECDSLRGQLASALPEPPKDTGAAKFLSGLAGKTESDLTNACQWSRDDEKRLAELTGMLKDPSAEAQRLERLASSLQQYADGIASAASLLADSKISEIAAFRQSAKDLRAQATASAAAVFASEPLPGVGEEPWRALFDAARAYSQAHAYPDETFPLTSTEARCVLCQQELDANARDRFTRFADFVTGAMNAQASAAEAMLAAALLAVRPNSLSIPELSKEVSDNLSASAQSLHTECTSYRNALLKRRADLLAEKDASQRLPPNPDTALRMELSSLGARAKEARALASASAGTAGALRTEHAELVGRKLLHDNHDELKRRIKVYQDIGKNDACSKACATKPISDYGGKLLKAHVTEKLANALKDEQKNLGIKSIPLSLTDRTGKAAIMHRLKLNGTTLAADTSSVLSEGEHRAVALAAFLSELSMYPGKDAIIIDDPVSSLDHRRRSRVAERLVVEAKDRQVVVFTHDLVFVSEVRFFAAKDQTPLSVIGIQRGPDGFGSLDPDGEPWLAKHLPGRRQWLTEQLARLKRLHAQASPDYEPQLRYFYDRLRESWEKLIEEKIFAQVISRFQPQVQTLRLKDAIIDDEIVTQVHFGMTAVSSYTGHDRPAAKGGALAEPDECERDLKALLDCLEQVESKSKSAAKGREPKMKPRKA